MLHVQHNKEFELTGLSLSQRGSLLAACVGSRCKSVSDRQLSADALSGVGV